MIFLIFYSFPKKKRWRYLSFTNMFAKLIYWYSILIFSTRHIFVEPHILLESGNSDAPIQLVPFYWKKHTKNTSLQRPVWVFLVQFQQTEFLLQIRLCRAQFYYRLWLFSFSVTCFVVIGETQFCLHSSLSQDVAPLNDAL